MFHAEDGLALLEVDPHCGPLTEDGLVGVVRRVAQEWLFAGVEPGTKKYMYIVFHRFWKAKFAYGGSILSLS